MRRWICRAVSVLTLALISGVLAFGQGFPDCRWNCRSNDVALESIYLEGPSTCLSGETVDASLFGMFVNGTGTERYDVALLADLVITSAAGTAVTELTVTNLTASIPPGATSLPIADISLPCGADVELRDVVVSWDTKEGGDLSCSARAVKCSMNPSIVVHDTPVPLLAEFSSSSLGCVEVPVSFINQTTGGTASSYSWDFGDGVGTSTNANPTYAYHSTGMFSVYLTVSDGGASTTASHEIEISPAPDADAWNGGPYCPGDLIELFAEGGTSYEWTGPGGFASSEQNPTIPDGEVGIYTVAVTNAASCSSSASTNVVADGVTPVLSVPADATAECGDDVSPASTGQATASDLDGASASITYVDTFTPDGCTDGTGSIERTWTATDSCGNTSSDVQTITVVDTTAPSLTVSSLSSECDGAGNLTEIETWLRSAAISDACGDVVVSHDYTGLTESCPGVGEATVAFVATDSCGNAAQRTATVAVVDTTPPTTVADTAIIDEDVAAEIDVLHNDSDVCSSALVLLSVGTPSLGVVEIIGEQVRYTPPAGFNGTANFSYTVADCSGLQSTGQVQVTVLARNDAPTANEALLTISEDVAASL
ncbi:PKD domain-containing protein, partial [Candidatus Bipolaricaulota bacterium]|nr:PKD domain-containing protein [Candidatus Bipolaricaulota bacterium]